MTVGVIFGGMSCEHNVSIVTGVQVLNMIRGYKTIPIYIDNAGVWWTGKDFDRLETFGKGKCYGRRVHIEPADNRLFAGRGKPVAALDCVINCCHGTFGEDGSLQGAFALSGIPLTGSGVAASAAGMDKITMKRLFREAGLPQTAFVGVTRGAYENRLFEVIKEIKSAIGFPMIVKPAGVGSSIGIGLAKDMSGLFECVREAFEWDNKIVVEEALTDFIEINCGVIGRDGDVETTELEQPVGWKEFLTYEDKYGGKAGKGGAYAPAGAKGDGKDGGKRKMPADVDEPTRTKIRTLAAQAFDTLGCSGVARVDFMVKDGTVYVNEINTVPGSLANYLFSYAGRLSPEKLIDRLVELAVADHRARMGVRYRYASPYALRR